MREIKMKAVLTSYKGRKFVSEEYKIDAGLWKLLKPECYYGVDLITTSHKFVKNVPEEEWEDIWALTHLIQPTYLKDKNGVEIYEGDILKAGSNYHARYVQDNCYVMYIEDRCRFVATTGNGFDTGNAFDLNCDAEIEVIGNIYENPELLEMEV